jgi:uncharacterized protein YuzE
MAQFPKVHWNWNERSVSIEFGPLPQALIHKTVNVVLDLDGTGEALAIEIIDLSIQTGADRQSFAENGGEPDTVPRWSYDRQADSLYVRLRTGRSLTQQERDGTILMGKDGRIARLQADWT